MLLIVMGHFTMCSENANLKQNKENLILRGKWRSHIHTKKFPQLKISTINLKISQFIAIAAVYSIKELTRPNTGYMQH